MRAEHLCGLQSFCSGVACLPIFVFVHTSCFHFLGAVQPSLRDCLQCRAIDLADDVTVCVGVLSLQGFCKVGPHVPAHALDLMGWGLQTRT